MEDPGAPSHPSVKHKSVLTREPLCVVVKSADRAMGVCGRIPLPLFRRLVTSGGAGYPTASVLEFPHL